ncbi:hypothetical protein H6G89_23265 [Oscillatoria sp. FACHB-1407]|uniref:hypothetical protein n=1 Tax=Oscillatoria sp. FACHB-1407 TaxID=2692847 RepID=UPI001684988E|nr:hypothetical protein [Oscillatoria sp. FACHB-1407]MBD2463926.1 hypothetical protein [Oscillatoria sp. FACHB-1407]
MAQVDLSPRELSIILASLEYWADNHDDDDPYDQMSEDMEQETFGEAGQPRNDEIGQLYRKLYQFDSGVQPVWRSRR